MDDRDKCSRCKSYTKCHRVSQDIQCKSSKRVIAAVVLDLCLACCNDRKGTNKFFKKREMNYKFLEFKCIDTTFHDNQ